MNAVPSLDEIELSNDITEKVMEYIGTLAKGLNHNKTLQTEVARNINKIAVESIMRANRDNEAI